MAIAIFRINYKSDFILTLQSDAGWMTPFCIKFWTGAPSQAYFAGYDGTTYTHCAPVEGEPTKLSVQFDDHHLPIGDLKFQIGYHFTVADFPTSIEDEVINQAAVIIDNDGEQQQVMLDFNGETAPEIQFSLPAYANEAQRIANEQERIAAEEQRIANEQQRIQNEEARIAAEQTRQQNEQQRINQEAARVSEFARLKTESEAATNAAKTAANTANASAQNADEKAALAQSAATLANAKAQLAADKAALAQSAATLANDKAQLAEDKANLAQQKADYAQTQGNYAKEQGDICASDHQTAIADHQRAQQDHTTAADDHQTAVQDNQTAMSDHQTALADNQTAILDHQNALSAIQNANTAAQQAGNVNVSLSGTIVTITDKTGHSESYDLQQSLVNAVLNGSVVTITDKYGVSRSINLLDADNTIVRLAIFSNVTGVSVAGLTINAYYDGSTTVSATITTDSDGNAVLTIPSGKRYRLEFPHINGCEAVEDIVGVADIVWQGYTVEYQQRYEALTVSVKTNTNGTIAPLSGYNVVVTVGSGQPETLVTDSNGEVTKNILYGETYSVTVANMTDYYVKGAENTRTFVAGYPSREVGYELRYYNVGLFYVLSDGREMTRVEFAAALDAGTVSMEDATHILVATSELIGADGCFAFNIDAMVTRNFPSGTWGLRGTAITTIPLNGNVATAQYYYDGLGACKAVAQWCDDNGHVRGDVLPSASLDETYEIAGTVHAQFLGSMGQLAVLWNNRFEIDDMLTMVRPNATHLLSTFTSNKWSCTQNDANNACYWAAAASYYGKSGTFAVVPFFAY